MTEAIPETAIDPVCGMTVKNPAGAMSATHAGQTYYFCNPKCHAKFEVSLPREGRG